MSARCVSLKSVKLSDWEKQKIKWSGKERGKVGKKGQRKLERRKRKENQVKGKIYAFTLTLVHSLQKGFVSGIGYIYILKPCSIKRRYCTPFSFHGQDSMHYFTWTYGEIYIWEREREARVKRHEASSDSLTKEINGRLKWRRKEKAWNIFSSMSGWEDRFFKRMTQLKVLFNPFIYSYNTKPSLHDIWVKWAANENCKGIRNRMRKYTVGGVGQTHEMSYDQSTPVEDPYFSHRFKMAHVHAIIVV